MRAYTLTADQAYLFFDICEKLNLHTEKERTMLLNTMAEMNQVTNVVEVKSTREEYIKHLADKFGKVLDITKKDK